MRCIKQDAFVSNTCLILPPAVATQIHSGARCPGVSAARLAALLALVASPSVGLVLFQGVPQMVEAPSPVVAEVALG